MSTSDRKHLNIDVESILSRYASADRRDYQIDAIRDVSEALREGEDILIDLPTGTGKTTIYAPIVADVAQRGTRALVLTATKRAQKWVGKEIRKFTGGSEIPLVFGVQEYHCPILNDKAQNWCCGELKEGHCKPSGIQCGVIKSEALYRESGLVVTNFSKFLLASADSKYDLIVLDDSHSFENAKEQAYQISVQFSFARQTYEGYDRDTVLKPLLENFLNLFSEIFERGVNPGEREGAIPADYVVQLAGLLPDSVESDIESEMRRLPEREAAIFRKIFYFLRRCKFSTRYQFYIQKDFYDPDDYDSSELISKNDQFVDFIVR